MSLSINSWVGLDVHEDSVTAAVFRYRESEPSRVDRMPNDLRGLRRYFQRLQAERTVIRACVMRRRARATSSNAPSPNGASSATWLLRL